MASERLKEAPINTDADEPACARIAELRSKLLNVEKCNEINTPKTWMASERLREAQMNTDGRG